MLFGSYRDIYKFKTFREWVFAYFSNKHTHGQSEIILIEKEKITKTSNGNLIKKETLLVNNDGTANTIKKDFAETVVTLNTFEWPSNNKDLLNKQLIASIL